jgi:hypothetical protein
MTSYLYKIFKLTLQNQLVMNKGLLVTALIAMSFSAGAQIKKTKQRHSPMSSAFMPMTWAMATSAVIVLLVYIRLTLINWLRLVSVLLMVTVPQPPVRLPGTR